MLISALQAEEDLRRIEAEAAQAKLLEEEERRKAERKKREEERAQAAEAARLQQQREEEAMRRREERKAAKAAPVTSRVPDETWRRGPPAVSGVPSRSGTSSPRPAPDSSAAVPRTRPPLFAGKTGSEGGWRVRETARQAASAMAGTDTASSAANGEAEASKPSGEDDDGFQTVPKRQQVWRPKRGRGI